MLKSSLFKKTFILLFVIGVLNYIGTYLYLYWTTSWFDIVMHFLGGVCVSMAFIYLHLSISKRNYNLNSLVKIGIVWGFIIGIVWEVYELYFGAALLSDGINYVTDTLSDLLMDIAGAIVGSIYSSKIKK